MSSPERAAAERIATAEDAARLSNEDLIEKWRSLCFGEYEFVRAELLKRMSCEAYAGAAPKPVNIGGQDLTPEKVVDLLWRYKKALEGLTPGGSEFVNDPENCAQFARNCRTHQHETIVRLTRENKAAERILKERG